MKKQILLKYFEIKAIVELGITAFIATGTNAVILFLKRRKDGFSIDRKRLTEEIFTGRYFIDPVFKRDYLDGHKFLEKQINKLKEKNDKIKSQKSKVLKHFLQE